MAVQVVDRVRQAMNTLLPVVIFYEAPTVALLAQRIQPSTDDKAVIDEPDARRLARKAIAKRGQRRREYSTSDK